MVLRARSFAVATQRPLIALQRHQIQPHPKQTSHADIQNFSKWVGESASISTFRRGRSLGVTCKSMLAGRILSNISRWAVNLSASYMAIALCPSQISRNKYIQLLIENFLPRKIACQFKSGRISLIRIAFSFVVYCSVC